MLHSTIHWHEGLFLRPQHLQLLDRQVVERVAYDRGLANPYSYGVIESKLSYDDLENFRVRFEQLEVILPDGSVISYPENTDLASLDIRQAFVNNPKGFTVYLALPLWHAQRANVLEAGEMEDVNVKVRFRVAKEVKELVDENTGQNPQSIQMRRYNAMLLLDDDDDSNTLKIPLLRINHDMSREESFPRLDPTFVPPLLYLGASPTLREMVKDLFAQVSAVREQLSNVVGRGSDTAINRLQLQQTLRLRSLNAFVAKMPALMDVGEGSMMVQPLMIYIELRALLGELMALLPEKESFSTVPYRHDDPYPSFQAAIAQIRNYLHGAVAPDYTKIDFISGKDDVQAVKLDQEHFSEKFAYFLCVKSSLEPSQVVELVQDKDQFKLMPASYLERAIRGVMLKEERYPPLELPAESGKYYFRLNTSQSRRIWDEIQREMEMVAVWSDHVSSSNIELTLFMTSSA